MTNKIESFTLYGREFKSINVCETCNKTGPTTINKMYCVSCLKAHIKASRRKKLDKLKKDPEAYQKYCDKINAQNRKDYQVAIKDPERYKKVVARKKRNRQTEYNNRRNKRKDDPVAYAKLLEKERIQYKEFTEKLKKDPEAYKEYLKNNSKIWRQNRRKAMLQKNKQTLINLTIELDKPEDNKCD